MNSNTTTNLPITEDADTQVTVEILDGKVTTTSLDVAKHFHKRHDNVIQAIRNLECSDGFRLLNFKETIQIVPGPKGSQRKEPAYRMTRDGFAFLCMGFTGKEAARWKEAYINAFNRMERALIERPEILSLRPLVDFALKTLELMRNGYSGLSNEMTAEQVVLYWLGLESLDQATPDQLEKAAIFLQGQIISAGNASKSLPISIGGNTAKELMYGLLRASHDAELIFNSFYDSGVEKLASETFKRFMAEHLAETSRQARELLGYISTNAIRTPLKRKPSTH